MSDRFLHALDDLPPDASVCMVGGRGRIARFLALLKTFRPDVHARSSIYVTPRDSLLSCTARDTQWAGSLSPNDLILVTSGKYKHLCMSLEEMGITRYLIVNPNFMHPFLHLRGLADDHLPKLLHARTLFQWESDWHFYDLMVTALSRKTDFRSLYNELAILHGRAGRQYLDFINPSVIATIIEGGLEDGRNTIQFLEAFPNAFVHGFEPDYSAFELGYFSTYLKHHPRVHIANLALWSRKDRLSLRINKAGSSSVCPGDASEEDCQVDATTIDDYVREKNIGRVDFIKLDIEGSELEALRGGAQTIAKHRPQLAVCLYHRLEHYYQIPLFLHQCAPDYNFTIGHYSPTYLFSETVLYAIPSTKLQFQTTG